MTRFDVAVVGGGAVGLAVALGLTRAGISTMLIGAVPDPADDGRTAALMKTSLDVLDGLDVRPALAGKGFPLAAIRLIDVTGGLLRSPTVTFRASEIDLPAFAENYSNADLVRTMTARLAHEECTFTAAHAASVQFQPDRVRLTLSDGTEIESALIVAADGARSTVRGAAGIGVRDWAYEQVALTFHVRHTRDHEDVSTEFHARSGPLTFVPYGDYTSSVVWLVTPSEAKALQSLSTGELAVACQRKSSSLLGDLTITTRVGAVPMRGLMAVHATAPRAMLAGEALHVFPPIGAQGLNLGLRDAKGIVDAVTAALEAGEDIGGAKALETYDAGRRSDATSRTLGVDLLNRTLIAGLLPLDMLRFAGLSAASNIAPLRRAMMRAGMGQSPLAPLYQRKA